MSDWIAALDWLIENHDAYPVRVVNLSIGTYTAYEGDCDADQPAIPAAVAELNALGVVVFAASGNNGSGTSLTSPACNSGVVAVGATYDASWNRYPAAPLGYASSFGGEFPECHDTPADAATIACFTNSNQRLALLAPGVEMTAAVPTDLVADGIATGAGTSQASAVAAGVAALVLEANPTLAPADVATVLAASGPVVTDPKNGLAFPRIDARRAVQLARCYGIPNGTPCDDADACTTGDTCMDGACRGSAVPDGTPCDDGSSCTSSEVCASGICTPSAQIECPAATACHEPAFCRIKDGTCVTYAMADGAPCADGDACTTYDACESGTCRGLPLDCSLAPPCHVATGCTAGACAYEPEADGAACDGGACASGNCVALDDTAKSASTGDGGCACRAPRSDTGGGLCGLAIAGAALLLRTRCRRPLRISQRPSS